MQQNVSSEAGISIIGIIPQYPNHSQQNIYGKIKMPPVGIISVLSQVSHDRRFKEVYAIDENNYRGPRDFMGLPEHSFLQKVNPASIAMFYGGMTNSIPRMFSLAKQYKKFGAITIAGGSHVDALPEEALRSGIDIVVHGEGEETTKEILDKIIKNSSLNLDCERLLSIKGISILDKNGKYIFTGKRDPIKNLNKLIDPDLTLLRFLKQKWTAIPINRGRGCNFNCEFCVVNTLYGSYKSNSVENSLRQIVKYSDMGYRDFFFTDDNFAQNITEAIELCKKIGDFKRKFKRKISLMVQVRSEVAENDQLIEAMRYAGVETMAIGFESPINEELKTMHKCVTVEKLIERSRKLSDYFYIHGMFIFSYPNSAESRFRSNLTLKEKAKEYIRFFRLSKIDTIQVLNAGPLPGSKLRARLEAEGRVLPLETAGWDKYDGLFLLYDPRPEGLDPYELQEIPKLLMKKRYLGSFLRRNLNYGNWIDWTYNVIGFPLQFGVFYVKGFVRNLIETRKEKSIKAESLLPKRHVFHTPLVNAFSDIKRRWRNLLINTYAGVLVRRRLREDKETGYTKRLKHWFAQRRYHKAY
jgi:radical SAM superfamily enzyme YgiQ (UPF0313 family)